MDKKLIVPDGFPYAGSSLKEIISPRDIAIRIKELGIEISKHYKNSTPIIIGILNGSVIFVSDLIRALNINCEVDFIKVESYLGEIKSSGSVQLIKDISLDISNRHVLIAEDIIDSGLTLRYLKKHIINFNPESIRIISLLRKNQNLNLDIKADWIGFNIDDNFVVGYGLDIKQRFRDLPGIYIVKD